jgi:hypothetical protein
MQWLQSESACAMSCGALSHCLKIEKTVAKWRDLDYFLIYAAPGHRSAMQFDAGNGAFWPKV